MSTPISNPPLAPALGSSGVFTLLTPFNVTEGVIYTVSAVRTFADLVQSGQDPMALIYSPVNLSQTDYQNDVAAGAVVIVLTSGTSPSIYVPSTYLNGQPTSDVVPYSTLLASVLLGPLPDGLDVTGLLDQIQQLAEATLGISGATVTLHAIPSTNVVTSSEDAAMTQARLAQITNNTTPYARLLQSQAALLDLQTRYNGLVAYLAANVPGATDMPSGSSGSASG
jgi:hypothetical protein